MISIALFALVAAASISLKAVSDTTQMHRALFLLEEGIEAARTLRDISWLTHIAPLISGTPYYLTFNDNWDFTSIDPGAIDALFTRTIVVDDVHRKTADDDIVSVSAPDSKYLDNGTKKVTVTVSWGGAVSETIAEAFEDGSTDGDLGNFPSFNAGDGDAAQSITTPAGSQITLPRVELFIKRASADPSDIFLEIRNTSTVGTVLATSQTIDGAALPANLSWVSFTFAAPPVLNPATAYYLRLRSIPDSAVPFSGSQGTLHWGYKQTGSSPYAGGTASRYVGRLNNPSDTGQVLTQYDFAFRAYKQVAGNGARQRSISTYITDLFQN